MIKSITAGALVLAMILCMAMPAFAIGSKARDLIDPTEPTDPVPSIGREVGGRKINPTPLPVTPRVGGKTGPITIPDPRPIVPVVPIVDR